MNFLILSIAASQANSPSYFKGLDELRVKESDRLELINHNLKNVDVTVKLKIMILIIRSIKNKAIDNNIRTDFDHRIAMSFAVLGSKIGKLHINESDSITTSFPGFLKYF